MLICRLSRHWKRPLDSPITFRTLAHQSSTKSHQKPTTRATRESARMPTQDLDLSTELDCFRLSNEGPTERRCSMCREVKPLGDYYFAKHRNWLSTSCMTCDTERSRRLKAKYISNGLCRYCRVSPLCPNSSQYCVACNERLRENAKIERKARRERGDCYQCAVGTPLAKGRRCETCFLKKRSGAVFGVRNRWTELKDIWDRQDGICVYTGIKMTLLEAQLDHKVPQSKGGSNDPGNLQFVLAEVNQMKKDLQEDRFFALIRIMGSHLAATGKIKSVNESLVPRLRIAQ